jgi:hypothetical protein
MEGWQVYSPSSLLVTDSRYRWDTIVEFSAISSK